MGFVESWREKEPIPRFRADKTVHLDWTKSGKFTRLSLFVSRVPSRQLDIHNPVFAALGLTIIAFVFFSLTFHEQAAEFIGWLRPALISSFDWVFMLAAKFFLVFSLTPSQQHDPARNRVSAKNFPLE